MAQTVPLREPASVVAGDSITWQRSLPDYPAIEGWVLSYRLINAAGKIDIAAGSLGADHLVDVDAATSAAWVAGTYTWQAAVTKGAQRVTVGNGTVVVKPDLAAQAAGFDTRSSAKKTLDLLDAAMAAHGSQAWTQEYEIAGRRMKYRSPGEFLAFRDKVKAEVAREDAADRIAQGLAPRTKVYVRF